MATVGRQASTSSHEIIIWSGSAKSVMMDIHDLTVFTMYNRIETVLFLFVMCVITVATGLHLQLLRRY